MCGSIYDSIRAGTVIYGAAALFLFSGSKEYIWLGSVLLVVGTIQVFDAILWAFRQLNIPTDSIVRYGIITILMLEPLIVYGGYVYYSGKRMPIYEGILLLSVAAMTTTWILNCEETTVTKDGYLKWCNMNAPNIYKILLLFLLLFPFFFFPNILQKVFLITLTTGTWLYNYNHEAFGSRWCYSSVIYSLVAVVIFLGEKLGNNLY